MKQFTRDEAVRFAIDLEWEKMTPTECGVFQLYQDLLCMPFSVFHEGLEAALGRPVWTHEFAYRKELIEEYETGVMKAGPLEKILRTHKLESVV